MFVNIILIVNYFRELNWILGNELVILIIVVFFFRSRKVVFRVWCILLGGWVYFFIFVMVFWFMLMIVVFIFFIWMYFFSRWLVSRICIVSVMLQLYLLVWLIVFCRIFGFFDNVVFIKFGQFISKGFMNCYKN